MAQQEHIQDQLGYCPVCDSVPVQSHLDRVDPIRRVWLFNWILFDEMDARTEIF
jgi:hypothetical protein